MKGKKLLAVTMAALMTSSSVGATVFAEEITSNIENGISVLSAVPASTGLSFTYLDADNEMVDGDKKAEGFSLTLNNVGEITNSFSVELCNNDTILSTTAYTGSSISNISNSPQLSVRIVTGGDADISSSWTTTLRETDWYNKTPNKIIVKIDGTPYELVITDSNFAGADKYQKMDVAKEKIAEVNGKTYSSLQKAYDNATNGATITLNKNIVLSKADIEADDDWRLVHAEGNDISKVTFDLGGHTIRLAEDAKYAIRTDANYYQIFNIYNTDCTIQNGHIDLSNFITTNGKDFMGVVGKDNEYLRLNVDITACKGGATMVQTEGKSEINGGKYTYTDNTYTNYPYVGASFHRWLMYLWGNKECIINGGTFVNFDPLCQTRQAFYTNSGLGEGKAMKKDGGTFTVVDKETVGATITRNVTCYENGGSTERIKERTYSYKTLKDAVSDAQDGDKITLLDNVTIDVTDKGYVYYTTIDGKKLTIDLNGKNIDWNIQYDTPDRNDWDVVFLINNGADVTITGNGKIDCDFGAGSHGSLAFLKGSSKLTIENGEFTSDDNIVFIYIGGGEVVVNDGKFSSSKLPSGEPYLLNVAGTAMSDDKKFTVKGGTFVHYDPSNSNDGNKVASGYTVAKNGNEYTVVPKTLAESVKVSLEPVVSANEDEKIYDLYLESTDGGTIKRLTSAQLALKMTTEEGDLDLVVSGTSNINVGEENGVYLFNYNGITATEETNLKIKLGQVKVTGYGKFKLGFDTEKTNQAHTTANVDNLVRDYAYANSTLALPETIEETIAVATRDLTIDVIFPNAVEDNKFAYQDMTVTIKGRGVNKEIKLGTDETAMVEGKYTITEELVKNIPYTVTISGAGYRTASYTVTMKEDKNLCFWNNVMTTAKAVEEGKDSSAKKATFLAGEIVKDGKINIYDLSAVVSYFGAEATENEKENGWDFAKYDLNRDGKVDSKDVAYVLASFNN